MKILVIGGTGQVGSKLREIINPMSFSFHFPTSNDLDLSLDQSILNSINKLAPDLVINLGAYTHVDLAEEEKDKANRINYLGVKYLSKITQDRGIGLIHFSTDYVFGNDGAPFKIKDQKTPLNHYGSTKSLGEDSVIDNHNNFLIIRLASVFSELGNNFVKTMFSLINDKKEVRVIGDQSISLTYAGDVASLIIFLCHHYSEFKSLDIFDDNIVHFTNKGFTNWFDVSKIIHEQISKKKDFKNLAQLINITHADWSSKALRSIDSRLNVNFDLFKRINIKIPSWESRVEEVIDILTSENN